VLITSTPTPENIATAAAVVLQSTADAAKFGPATPLPYNAVTPTPFPDYLIITPTPTPENLATAQMVALLGTAFAELNGTPTPFSTNAVTATPLPTGTPTPTYVIITSPPTPQSLMAMVTAIAEAQKQGIPTPLPSNWVTPVVVTATPVPANRATAEMISFFAPAQSLTTGTPTPLPGNLQPATPTPTYLIITSTPTPGSLSELATAIAGAQGQSLSTPLPANWVTPVVVTATPTPANQQTAQAQSILATAQALTVGTATPTPGNVQTATPTPIFNLIEPILAVLPTPLPLPTPTAIPNGLVGKILFLSDREVVTGQSAAGSPPSTATEEGRRQPQAYVFDPETGQLGRLTAIWPYEMAKARDAWSAEKRFRVFTKDATRYRLVSSPSSNGERQEAGQREDVPAVFWYDTLYDVEEQLTFFGRGLAYGGVWSPTAEEIAFVSNESGDDEIWAVNRDGSNLRQLTKSNEEYNAREIGKDTFIPELTKGPSWSPDGSQIVYFSNRSGNNQLWIMDEDGSNQRLVMDWNPYNDFDPVWVKYPDPPPSLP
jgi:hypothetical protein